MEIAVLDPSKSTVDILKIDDSIIPDNADDEWLESFMELHGYPADTTSWMTSDSQITVRTVSFSRKPENTIEKTVRTPKEWN